MKSAIRLIIVVAITLCLGGCGYSNVSNIYENDSVQIDVQYDHVSEYVEKTKKTISYDALYFVIENKTDQYITVTIPCEIKELTKGCENTKFDSSYKLHPYEAIGPSDIGKIRAKIWSKSRNKNEVEFSVTYGDVLVESISEEDYLLAKEEKDKRIEEASKPVESSTVEKQIKCSLCNGTGKVKYYYGESEIDAIIDGKNDYELGDCTSCGGNGYTIKNISKEDSDAGKVICDSCGKTVKNLVTKKDAAGVTREWCSSCWSSYDKIIGN